MNHKFIKRLPILRRIPIVHRSSIVNRTPLCSPMSWEKCCLCRSNKDCYGNKFSRVSSKTQTDYVVMYVPKKFQDWKTLEDQLWQLGTQKVFLRLITDMKLPKEVVWAASYSEHNIIQINLNMLEYETEVRWVDSLMSLANRCGVYCILCLNPIVPGVVRTYQVIELLSRLRNHGRFHTNLKFCRISKDMMRDSGWINFNGHVVSEGWLRNSQGVWECTSEFQKKFLEKVQLYSIPKKLSVSICGPDNDCTGLR